VGVERPEDSVKPKVTPLAELGPLLVYVTVPDTGWPAFTLAGKETALARSASATPVMVAVAVLLAGLGSAVVALIVAVTVEVPVGGCV
jgi:hypothetical protein